MQVHVDQERCQGHSRCYDLAPEVFDVDDLGTAFVLDGGRVPPGMEDRARLAQTNCPEHAIQIVEAP